jgi:hypothetical protein
MNQDEWKKRPMGIPLDPAVQKDPEEAGDTVPAEGRADFLNDITEQHGGQRTEVGAPYDGSGEVQRGKHGRYTGGDELRRKIEAGEEDPERSKR